MSTQRANRPTRDKHSKPTATDKIKPDGTQSNKMQVRHQVLVELITLSFQVPAKDNANYILVQL
jgi:hypothetical protein